MALADAITSMTNVTVIKLQDTKDCVSATCDYSVRIEWKSAIYLINANIKIILNPRAHPARLKTAGSVKAPVPTIRLKIYMRPICKNVSAINFRHEETGSRELAINYSIDN